MELWNEMARGYCLLVKKHALAEYSALVQKVLTLVDFDLAADLSLRAIAGSLNVNASYLSTRFKQETGITLTDYRFAGRIRFEAPPWPSEIMYLYRARIDARPTLPECDEGVLAWVDKKEALSLPMWEGDRVFLSLMEKDGEPFSLLLRYEGDTLVENRLGGEELFADEAK